MLKFIQIILHMKKLLFSATVLMLLSACSLVQPYSVTFTTQEDAVVNPESDTLDFVLSAPALAYISSYQCEGSEKVELLPVVSEESVAAKAYNLSLVPLVGKQAGSKCEINITAFDQTTTANSSAKISVYLYSKPTPVAQLNEFCGGIAAIQCTEGLSCKLDGSFPDAGGVCAEAGDLILTPDYSEQIKACGEAGGTWNECGSACKDPNQICIQVCVPQCEYPEAVSQE